MSSKSDGVLIEEVFTFRNNDMLTGEILLSGTYYEACDVDRV